MFGKLFSKSSFGLEISNGSLKFIELISNRNGFSIGRYGELMVSHTAKIGDVKNLRQIDEFFLTLRKKEKIKSVYVSLPDEEMENKDNYISFFNRSNIKVKSFESKGRAISRSIIKDGDMGTYMIISFNEDKSSIWITSKGVLMYCNTIPSNIYVLRDEVAKYFLNWHIGKEKEDIKNSLIQNIVLCGDGSDLPELAEYLSVNLRNKVELANVWVNILDTRKNIPEISFKQSLGFASALGVALEGF